jgi:hypothetical protein
MLDDGPLVENISSSTSSSSNYSDISNSTTSSTAITPNYLQPLSTPKLILQSP